MPAPEIIVIAHGHDLHAHIVVHALEIKGVPAALWSVPNFADQQFGSIRIGPDQELTAGLTLDKAEVDIGRLRTVWARRPLLPAVPPGVDPRDAKQVKQENSLFVQGLWWALSEKSFWVNPYSIRRQIKSKPLQLAAARAVGLGIPPTIFGNDPAAIRAFLAEHAAGGAIYKPHRISEWEENGSRFLLHTSELVASAFSDDQFRICAGTYQARIEKAYELRIHVMGQHVIAIKIDSQAQNTSMLDWRSAHPSTMAYEVVSLGEERRAQVLALLAHFGAVFGIIDAIVTPDGELVFLEINEMGQFLWVDAYCPEARLLDHFCQFLISASAGYRGELCAPSVAYLKLRGDPDFIERFERSKCEENAPEYEVDWIDILV